MKRILLLLIIVVMTAACSIPSLDRVLSDTRTDYQKSKSLPPLDVPPDLSASEAKGSMGIPGEVTSASLKAYQNRNNPQKQAASNTAQNAINTAASTSSTTGANSVTAAATTAPATVSVPLPKLDADGGAFITVQGQKTEVWNKLRDFFSSKGYQVALDDIDLGYMETAWSAPAAEDGHTYRHKFKVFTEAEKEAGVTGLYIDNEQQEQVVGASGNTTWQNTSKNADVERLMAGAMNVYFNGAQAQVAQQPVPAATGSITPATSEPAAAAAPMTTHTASALPALAEIRNLGNNKILLAVPEEYTLAWRKVGEALQGAGLVINSSDQGKGVYHVTYHGAKPEKSGWLSKLKKLKFWGKHENEGAGTYQVALTGVGDKTEIVVLKEDGGWASYETSNRILSMIQTQYNRS